MKRLFLILIVLVLTGCNNQKHFDKNLFYMDTLINIKIYNNNESKVNEAFDEIEKLYKKYDEITNFYNENSELFLINNNKTNVISDELYNLIEMGISWYYKSNGLLNINIGDLTQKWHDFRQNGTFPTDLDNVDINIEHIKLLENNTISGDFNIDMGAIVKGYVTELAGKYLESVGLSYYIINAGGNVKTGKSYKGYYNIGIASPIDNSTFYVLKSENISVVTSGGYERFYELNGIMYHHIINPYTKYPANNMKSVTVIGKNSGLCDILSTVLFLMDVNEGKEFVKDYDVDVIWFTNNNEIIKSDGFSYE